MNDSINSPAHYTMYPVEPIEITRHLGFCLGNAVKYILSAPYKGGVEDCLKAQKYLEWEIQWPASQPSSLQIDAVEQKAVSLIKFLLNANGDQLWHDIAIEQFRFLSNLLAYHVSDNSVFLHGMDRSAFELRRILALRDTTCQIYEGMTGLPERGGKDG